MTFTDNDYHQGEELFFEILSDVDSCDSNRLSYYDLKFSIWSAKLSGEMLRIEQQWVPWIKKQSAIVRVALGDSYLKNPQYSAIAKEYSRSDLVKSCFKQLLTLSSQIIDTQTIPKQHKKKIFIVHGHDIAFRDEVKDYLKKENHDVVVLSELPNHGLSVFDKLWFYAQDIGFAIVLLTADDLGRSIKEELLKKRSRQNVILEWGFFGAFLEKGRIALIADDIEIPSDMRGITYYTRKNWKQFILKDLEILEKQ